MSDDAKSGPDIVKDFFEKLASRTDLDAVVVKTICDLYVQGKLSNTQITNALEKARTGTPSDNN